MNSILSLRCDPSPTNMESDELVSEDKYLLVAKADNVKHISSLLRAVNFKDVGVCFATEHGLKIVVEDSKCVQANTFIGSEIFQEYQLADDTVAFRVDLNTLIECLTIFDGCSTNPTFTTALKLTYKEYGSPVKLLLEEGGIITDCSLRTMEVFDILDFSIPAESTTSKIIIRSSDFKDILNDIDSTSDYVEFTFSEEPQFFKILTSGIAGKCSVEIPSKSEIMEQFVCNATITVKYKYKQIKPFLKCMNISQKTLIRTNEEGLLCCQFMVQVESHTCYLEYFSESKNYDLCWSLRGYYLKSNSDEKRQHAARTTPDLRQFTAVYSDHSLNVFMANETVDRIRLVPDTYVLRSTVHLGILLFDDLVGRWWVLSFWDELSAVNCASTLQAHIDVTVTDIEKVLSDRARLENGIVKTIMDPTFLHFVADVENAIVKETQNTFDHDFNYSFNQK